MRPHIGCVVHYVSLGSADGRFPSTCRAAIVTATHPGTADETSIDVDQASLAVLNPTGLFFDQGLPYRTALPGRPLVGGSWHHSSECGPA